MESTPQNENDANEQILEKCHVTIRLKPLGSGKSDSNLYGTEQGSKKVYAGGDYENHSVTFKDVSKKKDQVYKFPSLVATGDFDNERLYNEMMKFQVDRFLDGFNVNFMAYGQTGSGKTFTTSGPSGCFKQVSDDAMDNIPADFGLFPRAAIDIYKAMLNQANKYVMTICVCESNYQAPLDLVTKKQIKLDPLIHEFMGQEETVINSPIDIWKIGDVVEKERTAASTKMNAASSRTHCLIWIKLYRQQGNDKIRINSMRFIDLAGSERAGKSQESHRKLDKLMAEAIMINYSLTVFARVSLEVSKLKKPIVNGGEIPNGTCWKETAITRILKESYNGLAFSSFLFCLSQAQNNSGESWSTCNFAEKCQVLKTKTSRPKIVKVSTLIKSEETAIKNNQKALKQLQQCARKDPSSMDLRQQLIDRNIQQIKLLQTFS